MEKMEIIQPAHKIHANKVKNWRQIKKEALVLRDFIQNGKFKGDYSQAYAISHAQVSDKPMWYFVLNESIEDGWLKKQFGSWCIVNAEIIKFGDPCSFEEACMSFPFRKPKRINRFNDIIVKYKVPYMGILWSKKKQFKELPAFIIQHEQSHNVGENIYGK